MNLLKHLQTQMDFSAKTFGPGPRMEGVSDHIRKELVEIKDGKNDPREWVDVVLLGLDGLWRSLRDRSPALSVFEIAYLACEMIRAKQAKNMLRKWPDWRTQPKDQAIGHIK